MKTLIAIAAAAAVIAGAPSAQAYPFDASEIDFINDVQAIGLINSGGEVGIVNSGWTICNILSRGYPREWVAEQVYIGSQSTNGTAGISYSSAQALVFYANVDLCPGVGQ